MIEFMNEIVDKNIICTIYYVGVGFLERYGWFIVLGLVVLVFLWIKLKPYWKELQDKWECQREIANFGEYYSVHPANSIE